MKPGVYVKYAYELKEWFVLSIIFDQPLIKVFVCAQMSNNSDVNASNGSGTNEPKSKLKEKITVNPAKLDIEQLRKVIDILNKQRNYKLMNRLVRSSPVIQSMRAKGFNRMILLDDGYRFFKRNNIYVVRHSTFNYKNHNRNSIQTNDEDIKIISDILNDVMKVSFENRSKIQDDESSVDV